MLYESMDIYCERVSAHFWSEPINALTNIFIFLAGVVGYLKAKSLDRLKERRHIFFCSVIAMITGVGSFLFHTYANRLTMWMDIIPITVFQIGVLNYYLKFIFKLNLVKRTLLLVGFVYISLYLGKKEFMHIVNGSLTYIPSLIALFLFSFITYRLHYVKMAKLTLLGLCSFIVSLTARSLDMSVCSSFPMGTHFIWHTLNGLLILSLLFALIQSNREYE